MVFAAMKIPAVFLVGDDKESVLANKVWLTNNKSDDAGAFIVFKEQQKQQMTNLGVFEDLNWLNV
jgi:hypothetical protein